jgi:hypothetical protein
VAVYREGDAVPIVAGDPVTGPFVIEYTLPPLSAGRYLLRDGIMPAPVAALVAR